MPIILAHTAPARLHWHSPARRSGFFEPAAPWATVAIPQAAMRDAAFVALQSAFRSSGGIERGDVLAAHMGQANGGGYVDLARSIVAGRLFSFRWHDSFWVPLFQLDPHTLTLRESPRRVLDELHGVFDGWDMALWHTRAHEDLGGLRPLDMLDKDLPAVLAAARSDRHAIDG